MDVSHTAIWVPDLEAALEFYVDGLGLEHAREFELDGVTNSYVAGDDGFELQFKYDESRDEPVEPSGIDHIAIEVDDTDAVVERLVEETSAQVVNGPMTVESADARVAFVEDLNGYVLEIVQYLA